MNSDKKQDTSFDDVKTALKELVEALCFPVIIGIFLGLPIGSSMGLSWFGIVSLCIGIAFSCIWFEG